MPEVRRGPDPGAEEAQAEEEAVVSEILGVNKRWYYGEGNQHDLPDFEMTGYGEQVCLCTVLVAGDIGDYAAYQGIGDRPEWIARHGDKISFKEATCHFPFGLEESKYRL